MMTDIKWCFDIWYY